MTISGWSLRLATRTLMGMYVGVVDGVFIDRNVREGNFDAMVVGACIMGLLGGLGCLLESRVPKWGVSVTAGIVGLVMGLVWGDNGWTGVFIGAAWMALTASVINRVESKLVIAITAAVILSCCALLVIQQFLVVLTPAMVVALSLLLGLLVGIAAHSATSRREPR